MRRLWTGRPDGGSLPRLVGLLSQLLEQVYFHRLARAPSPVGQQLPAQSFLGRIGAASPSSKSADALQLVERDTALPGSDFSRPRPGRPWLASENHKGIGTFDAGDHAHPAGRIVVRELHQVERQQVGHGEGYQVARVSAETGARNGGDIRRRTSEVGFPRALSRVQTSQKRLRGTGYFSREFEALLGQKPRGKCRITESSLFRLRQNSSKTALFLHDTSSSLCTEPGQSAGHSPSLWPENPGKTRGRAGRAVQGAHTSASGGAR
jgi:hypothetical protein